MLKNLSLLLDLSYGGYNLALRSNDGTRGEFQPIFNEDGSVQTTFCNQFVQFVLRGYGYDKMNGLNANTMFDFMSIPANGWLAVSGDVAQAHANDGVLTLAAYRNPQGHGHVCLILPGILEKSNSWAKLVPKCVNVGKDVFFGRKVSYAFSSSEMPTYFSLSTMI